MRVDLHAGVRTSDGEEAGRVDRVVIDPETNEITDFVVSTGGFLGRDLLVPRQFLERASREGDVLRLELSREKLEEMADYVPANYVVPPADRAPSFYGYTPTAYLWPMASPFAFNPEACSEPTTAERPTTAGIEKGAVVLDRRGEDVGVVDDVLFDLGSGRLRGLVVRLGGALRTMLGGGESVEIDARHIGEVSENVVHLRMEGNRIRQPSRR